MSGSHALALVEARRLVRTFASAPDPRRRAQAVISELRQVDGWSTREQRDIEALEAWLRDLPPLTDLEPRCRALMARLGR